MLRVWDGGIVSEPETAVLPPMKGKIMTVQFAVTEHPVTVPRDTRHTPCGLFLPDYAELIKHVQTCPDCRAWACVVRGRW